MSKAAYRCRILLVLPILFVAQFTDAQIQHPDGGILYGSGSLARIELSMAQSSLDSLNADPESNREYRAAFSFVRGSLQEGPIEVGVRYRGDTTRNKIKRSYRIAFDAFDGSGDFHGVEKLNLNAERNDPSLLRSKASFSMLRRMGVPAPRSNHIMLVINGTFQGIYLNTEVINEDFLKSRLDNNDGNLYRCRDLADLVYLGKGGDFYKFEVDGKRSYALRTNEYWDDYEDLSELITTLQQSPQEDLPVLLEEKLNVQTYLKALAVEVLSGNWDSYGISSTNFYLYRDQHSQRFEYLPYRLENTLGISYDGRDYSDRSLYDWAEGNRPLYDRLMQQELYQGQFSYYLRSLIDYSRGDLSDSLAAWQALIAPWVDQDPLFGQDWGFTAADFASALDTGWGTHVHMGLEQFLEARCVFAEGELQTVDAHPAIVSFKVIQDTSTLNINWNVEDDLPGVGSQVLYRTEGWDWKVLSPSGAVVDPVTGQSAFQEQLEIPETGSLDLYFSAWDAIGQTSSYIAGGDFLHFDDPYVTGPLLINEFMASNATTLFDEYGEFDDWVEVYNAGDASLDLSDYYLSDQNGDPGKYRFPRTQLEAGGFYLVWIDDQEQQGENHADFKLSKNGERIRLSLGPSEGFRVVDSLSYGPQTTDVSYGRMEDGGEQWTWFPDPTPEYSNLLSSLGELADQKELAAWPNPLLQGDVLRFSRPLSGSIFSVSGMKVMEISEQGQLSTARLVPGLYILVSRQGEQLKIVVQ